MRYRRSAVGRLAASSILITFSLVAQGAPKIEVAPDVEAGVYEPGKSATWNVTITDNGSPVAGKFDYDVKKAGAKEIAKGTVELRDGKGQVTASREDAGTLLLNVTYKAEGSERGINQLGGAAFAPDKVAASMPVPDDFDAFWAEKLAELASVPFNAKLEAVVDGIDPAIEYYKITLDNIRGAKVQGQIAKPKGKSDLPAMMQFQYSGVYPLQRKWVVDPARNGWLAMNISAHDLPIDEPQDFYRKAGIDNYTAIGDDDREKSYFLRMFLGCSRAVDYLVAHPDWNKKTIVVHGGSQGGYQALATGALHPAVTAIAAQVPAGCDQSAKIVGRPTCWPHWTSHRGNPDALLTTSRYFDAMNFAHRIKCPTLVGVGLLDTTCPAENVIATYNQIGAGQKQLIVMPRAGHNDGDHKWYTDAYNPFMEKQKTRK